MPHKVSSGKGKGDGQKEWWAKTEWTKEHYKVARRLAKSLPPVRSAAWDHEDTIQEVALRYQEKIQQRTGNKPSAWLRALLYNQNVTAHRKEDEIRGHKAEGNRPKVFVDIDGLTSPPAPAHSCSESNELLYRFFREGLGSPITKQCLEHLRVCASCAGLLQYVALELIDFIDNMNSKMIHPSFVRLMDELGMRNGARQFLRRVRRSALADLQRFECSTNCLPSGYPDREQRLGMVRQELMFLDRNLELLRNLRRRCKRNLGIRRGTPEMTFLHTLSDTGTLLLLLSRDAEITMQDDCLFIDAPTGGLGRIIVEHTLANLALDSWGRVLPAFMKSVGARVTRKASAQPLIIVTRP